VRFVYLALALVIVLSTACITVVRPGATAPGGTSPVTQKPAAFIDRISPSSLNWGESVNFTGHGTSPSGTITAYLWRSSIDENLGSLASFDTTRLSPGSHTIFFSVQDSAGNWSLETQGTVNVISGAAPGGGTPPGNDQGPAPFDDSGTPPPADSGAPPADEGAPPADAEVPPADSGVPPADAGVPPALKADLRITTGNPTVNPSTVAAGGNVSLSGWTVKNEGTAASGAFSNGFYLSTNQVISSSDTYLDGNSNVSLAPGAQHSWGVATLTIPAGTAPGNYYIGILVDRANAVVELAGNNNYVSTPLTVTAGAISRPDLRITTGNPTVNPSTVAAGGNVSLSGWTVKNEGTAASGAFSNGFYLSTNQVISSSDTYLDGNSNVSLAAGAQHSWGGVTLTIPAGTAPGNYYIGILVDRANAVVESAGNNNYVSTPLTVTAGAISRPDLRITTGNPTVNPSTVAAGGKVSLSGWTVKNEGTAASGAFSNGFYLSTNQVISSSDTYLDGNSNVSLAPGAQHSWGGVTLTIPAGTAPGNYYIGILVDRANAVVESAENNNYVSCPITVTAAAINRPDLRITTGNPTLHPLTVLAGGNVTLSDWTIKNEGTAASGKFSNGFYLSNNQIITSGDTFLTDNYIQPGLAAGAQYTWLGPTLTIPHGTPPGNYYIGILVDRNNAVAESNEMNNYVSSPVKVIVIW